MKQIQKLTLRACMMILCCLIIISSNKLSLGNKKTLNNLSKIIQLKYETVTINAISKTSKTNSESIKVQFQAENFYKTVNSDFKSIYLKLTKENLSQDIFTKDANRIKNIENNNKIYHFKDFTKIFESEDNEVYMYLKWNQIDSIDIVDDKNHANLKLSTKEYNYQIKFDKNNQDNLKELESLIEVIAKDKIINILNALLKQPLTNRNNNNNVNLISRGKILRIVTDLLEKLTFQLKKIDAVRNFSSELKEILKDLNKNSLVRVKNCLEKIN